MKKTLTFLLAVLGGYHGIHAQNTFYLKLGGGYAFPSAPYTIGTNNYSIYLREKDPEHDYYHPAYIDTYKEVNGTYATGVTASGTAGYMFTKNMGVEVHMSYLHGKKYTVTVTQQDIIDDEIINGSKGTNTSKATTWLVAPSFVLAAGESALRPYVSAGVVFGFSSMTSSYRYYSTYENSDGSRARDEKYSGGVSLGLRGALGLDIKLNERFTLFSEVAFSSLSFYPKESEVTKYSRNGEDLLPSLTERERRMRYVKEWTRDTRNDDYHASDKPGKAGRFSFGMSNIATTAGIKFSFL